MSLKLELPTQEFKSVKSTLRALEELNLAMSLSIQIQKQARGSSPSGEERAPCVRRRKRKIKEQIAKEKEEGEKI